MKKSVFVLIILMFAAMTILPACSFNSEPSDGKVTIVHYTLDSDDKRYIEKLVPEFEKKYPNIRVKIVKAPWTEFDAKLHMMIAAGKSPDVFSHWGEAGFSQYYSKGLVYDLTDLMNESGFKPEEYGIPQKLMDIYKVNGRQYGIPVYSYVSLLAYNKDMFDKAGLPYPPADYEDRSWTFEKMMEYAKKLTKVTGNIRDTQYGLEWLWGQKDMNPIYFGAKVYSDDTWTNGGKPTESYFNSPEVIQAVQTIQDLTWKEKVSPPPAFSQAVAGQGGDPFAAGKVAMKVTGAWVLSGSNNFKFKVGVAAIPRGKNDKVRDVLYVDPLLISSRSKHPKEAFEWVKFLVSEEAQKKGIVLSGGTPPANQKAVETYYHFFKNINPEDLRKVYEGGIKYGTESYNHLLADYTQIITIVNNEFSAIDIGQKSAKEVLPAVDKKVDKLLKKRQKIKIKR